MSDDNETTKRYPLRLPPDLDKEIRDIASGKRGDAPNKINNVLVHLLRQGLKAQYAKQ